MMDNNYSILKKINKPNDIKKLSFDELNVLSNDVREYIIDVISKNGGHLASSLGVVDLTIALLLSFDVDKDKIIWDVGHQSYAYKILTDRKNEFENIRKFGGISGFPKRNESKYDVFDTGHSSTSISAGMGIAISRDIDKKDYKVISVIGDGSLTSGMALEALNNLSNLKTNFILILNDNGMSISKSIGGINKALLGIRSSQKYNKFKLKLKTLLEKSKYGMFIKDLLTNIINVLKQVVIKQGMFFENLDIDYVGPIDGHNIKQMKQIFDIAKHNNEPIVIHIKTIKGKGYIHAENNPTKYHGIASFDKSTGEVLNKTNKKTWTNVLSDSLIEIANINKKVVAITAAMSDGVGLSEFSKKYKNRFFDVGICEQHAITFGAGLAINGFVPVVCIYSSFLQRSFDQIIHDVCLQNLHMVICIDRAGIVGADGETHQGIFDISFLRLMPNMIIMAPKNDIELKNMIDFSINNINSPVAIRYPRGQIYDELYQFDETIKIGKSEVLFKGEDLVIFALGSMVKTAIELKNKLDKISVSVINARFAKPIDFDMIDKICSGEFLVGKIPKQLLLMEEGIKNGSMCEAIEAYILEKKYKINVKSICINDTFVSHGSVEELKHMLNIDTDSIIKNI